MEQPLIDLDEGKFQAEESRMVLPVPKRPTQSRMSGIFPIHIKAEEEESSNARVRPFQCNEPCIFRVHEGLRHVNPNAYTPMLVSIGPYHHGKQKFHDMEEHKKRYRDFLLKHMNLQGKDLSLEDMKKKLDISKARNYYANSIDDFNEEKLAEMMLLDGCFVIEFLRKLALKRLGEVVDDPIFRASWMHIQICCDLMLLENQLPFFVLSQLSDMTETSTIVRSQLCDMIFLSQWFDMTETSTSECHPLLILAMLAILQVVPNQDSKPPLPTCEPKHFLDLVHNAYLPQRNYGVETDWPKMPCVTELREAGVKFIQVEGSMFDIDFKHGQLKIPKFTVSDSTEGFFRNIIAYEQHSSDADHKYFTDFTHFMDLLINSAQDVSTLRHCDIIDHMLGTDKQVAAMFNELGDGIIISPNYTYSKLSKEVNDHCNLYWNNFWNKKMADLRRDYFNTPWATVSTIAAAFLLILTVMQTVVALIPLLA